MTCSRYPCFWNGVGCFAQNCRRPLTVADHNLPWVYRPRESDDWGWIRDADGDLAACARGKKGNKTLDGYRRDGTDPYGKYAAFIVKAVNNHDSLVKALADIIEVEKEFRNTMPCDWDGDPLSDACDAAAKLLTDAVGSSLRPASALSEDGK